MWTFPWSSSAKSSASPSQIGSRTAGKGLHWRSMSCVSTRRSPVATSTTAIWLWRGRSHPPGLQTHAIAFPSETRTEVVDAVVVADPPHVAAGRGHAPDLLRELRVPVVVASRRKRDRRGVGRPGRRVVLEVAVRQLERWRGAVRRHDEEVRSPVSGPADRVELVAMPCEPAWEAPLVVGLVVRRVGHTGREGDPRAVRRPDGLGRVLLQLCQARRLTAFEREHVQLLVVAFAIRDEREPAAVGRPARRRVGLLAGRHLPRRRRAVHRREPDRREIRVLLLVDRGDDVGDRRAVRGEPRIRRPDEVVEVFRAHGDGAYRKRGAARGGLLSEIGAGR